MSKTSEITDLPNYRVIPGETVDLTQWPTSEKGPYKDKKSSRADLDHHRARIVALQERLWAEHKQSLLVILPGDRYGWQGWHDHARV